MNDENFQNFYFFSGSQWATATNIAKNEGEVQQSFSRPLYLNGFLISFYI